MTKNVNVVAYVGVGLLLGALIGWGAAQSAWDDQDDASGTGRGPYGRVMSVHLTCEYQTSDGSQYPMEDEECERVREVAVNASTTFTVLWPDDRIETITVPGLSSLQVGDRWPPR